MIVAVFILALFGLFIYFVWVDLDELIEEQLREVGADDLSVLASGDVGIGTTADVGADALGSRAREPEVVAATRETGR